MDYKRVYQFAEMKHRGQKRKTGEDYFSHPREVARMLIAKGFSDRYAAVGLLHDVIEDTNATYDDVLLLTDVEIADAVRILTKMKGYDMAIYVACIMQSDLARQVKCADRLHNLRSALPLDLKFRQKYLKETQQFYLPMFRGTKFEKEMLEALDALRTSVMEDERQN